MSQQPTGADENPSNAELVQALQQAVGLVRAHFAAATARAGVTPVQAKVLRELSDPLTLKDLSARLGADLSNTSGTVDRLESQGLLRKLPHQTDRRARLLTLTPTGERIRQTLEDLAFSTVPPLDVLSQRQRHDLNTLLRLITSSAR
ncbi:MarR family winged helix-turn-helix transcriptional regulator [Nocardia sp. NPDC050630]|uniref:MarR family winged helix-turn-helix transcriptional regulator n=1 Tax=Nocardia sp. NPDC050630 TaxID=3364321 RepID=UPI00378AD40B